jgi:FlaA1/EpsC-like NDP-sugar epimerase
MSFFRKIDEQWLLRALTVLALDVISIAASFFAALWVRFEFSFDHIPERYFNTYLHYIGYWIVICLVVFWVLDLYNSIWTYVSVDSLGRVMGSYAILLVVAWIGSAIFDVDMPRSFYFIGFFLSFACTVGIRFSYRLLRRLRWFFSDSRWSNQTKNIMIIGAGEAGRQLVREFTVNPNLQGHVACLIDDNPNKHRRILEGVRVVGGRNDIPAAVDRYNIQKIIYAIPASDMKTRREILDICSTTGCEIQVVPGMFQLVNGEVSVSKLRKVSLLDLLGRDPVQTNLDEIRQFISGKVVMVTGGGGSIGSELCRQIAQSNPKQLIIFDIYENNAYEIQMELKRTCPGLNLAVLIGSVRDPKRLDDILGEYRPELVFHAAAHKHVPLMEDSPNEAIKNNVFGTYKMAHAAREFGVKKFVLISTDKAVNPTNIMGASKRLCEMVVQMMSRKGGTEFVAVRFGNVLGSNGSVVPLFEKQIAEGGPVTVTHPDITRFFMTIPEAVSLVLQAGYYARGGEIFVLDMGQPVKIDDMARQLIRLSGFEPDVDIKVVYTGLRPGEKLYEEILMDEEGLQETANKLIHIGRPIQMDDAEFARQMKMLESACAENADNIKDLVADIVPTYHPQTE